jgi:branched-chain amino acid transport system permease protein
MSLHVSLEEERLPSISTAVSLLIDGVAYGMILFMISSGFTVTLGIMRIVNLAHCGFAMIGGYAALGLMTNLHLTLLEALPVAIFVTILIGVLLEKTIYRIVYRRSALGQILMTVGLAYVMAASVNALFGSLLYNLPLPDWLNGVWNADGISVSIYRIFLVVTSLLIGIAMWVVFDVTSFGARLRASIDNPQMARAVGIKVDLILSTTFAAGCGLAAVGGVLGTQLLPLEPFYAIKYLVLVLMVIAVGGLGSLRGSLIAGLLLGLTDTVGRYTFPGIGGFVIYAVAVAMLLIRPRGLFARA